MAAPSTQTIIIIVLVVVIILIAIGGGALYVRMSKQLAALRAGTPGFATSSSSGGVAPSAALSVASAAPGPPGVPGVPGAPGVPGVPGAPGVLAAPGAPGGGAAAGMPLGAFAAGAPPAFSSAGGRLAPRSVPAGAPTVAVIDAVSDPKGRVLRHDLTAKEKEGLPGPPAVLVLAKTQELARAQIHGAAAKAAAAAPTAYAVVLDKPGDARDLLRIAAGDFQVNLPSKLAPRPSERATGWAFRVAGVEAGRPESGAFALVNHISSEKYAL